MTKRTERQRAITRLDKKFSKKVRMRDADENGNVQCCTCGKWFHWKQVDCGHFQSRRHLSVRWEEKNTGPQCKSCNMFNQGVQYKFGKYLDKRWGEGTADLMVIRAQNTSKLTVFELQQIEKQL